MLNFFFISFVIYNEVIKRLYLFTKTFDDILFKLLFVKIKLSVNIF